MMVQIQHQNISDLSQRVFVAQGEFTDEEAFEQWKDDIIARFPPDKGWQFLVATQKSELFYLQA